MTNYKVPIKRGLRNCKCLINIFSSLIPIAKSRHYFMCYSCPYTWQNGKKGEQRIIIPFSVFAKTRNPSFNQLTPLYWATVDLLAPRLDMANSGPNSQLPMIAKGQTGMRVSPIGIVELQIRTMVFQNG